MGDRTLDKVAGNKVDQEVDVVANTIGLATSAKQDTIIGHVDSVETKLDTVNTNLGNLPKDSTTQKEIANSNAETADVWDPAPGLAIRLTYLHIDCAGACDITVFFTDSANNNAKGICKLRFTAAGSWDIALPVRGLKNPNGADGKLRYTSSLAIAHEIYAYGVEE